MYYESMTSIISWNVNGIRAVEKKGFVEWLKTENPDILCVQETKARPEQLTENLRTIEGYHAYFSSAKKPGYSGTAIYTRRPPDTVTKLNIPEFDDEGRVTIAHFGDLLVISAYFPNSQEAGARLPYKLAFCEALLAYCDANVKAGKNIVLCGDYNIAHKPIDLANPKANEHNPGYLPEERAFFTRFLEHGYLDTFRLFCAEPDHYTWWSYRFHAREKNIGWRIDYACVNEALKNQIHSSEILNTVYGSDHCPIKLVLS